ncbi:MAG TPA: helix-turn-helix domain-containing protein [Pseudonocardiaceae bacterium]|nr:helix-turn-helix domain-containing protein [Pseudonocardiaceae bacterium]
MSRLSRAQAQELNRARVLAAARDEFAEHGFRNAKIDAIAERAELTRGAVYSNFPGKRALYFAVLADLAEHAPQPDTQWRGETAREALGAFALAWLARPPDGMGLHDEVLTGLQRPYTQLLKLNALLLALALERLAPPEVTPGAPPRRLGRLAESVLTTLHGARQLAATAPGFVEPFDVVSACERLAGLELNDFWAPPTTAPPQPADEPWSPPKAVDAVRNQPARLDGDGVLVVVGPHRLGAIEDAVRSGSQVTAVLVTSDVDELAPLARLTVAELCGCLRQAFPRSAWPDLQLVHDESGALAAAAGVPTVSDDTEVVVRIENGRMVGATLPAYSSPGRYAAR